MINRVAFSIFGLNIYWYGLTYVIGFLFSFFFIKYYSKNLKISNEQFEDLFFYFILFSVLGGRIFHILFYNISYYISNPIKVFYVWEGGMSIHGGFFFGFLVLYYYSKKYKIELLKLTDLFLIPTALGLAFGRLANFVNQELVGTITSSSLGITFPLYDDNLRWPYTIFAGFKNLVVFNILYYLYVFKKLKPGIITALFLILYNLGRFFLDFIREPEVILGVISMGQLLSLFFGLAGFILLYKLFR